MNLCTRDPLWRIGLLAILLCMFNTGCGGDGQDPVLGPDGMAALAPTVIAVTPAPGVAGVDVAGPNITATL